MPKNGKRGGGDRVLESRHLVLLFLSVVLLCGVFFTLGYVMGHTQYGGSVQASDSPARPQPPVATPKTAKQPSATSTAADKSGWGSDEPAKSDDPIVAPAPKPAPKVAMPVAAAAPKGKSVPVAERQPPKYNPPALNKNSIVLQVAAVKQQHDALEMADELQKKRFPAFVVNSQADGFYHVQVGPYPDKASADAARHSLEQAGFKAIIKH